MCQCAEACPPSPPHHKPDASAEYHAAQREHQVEDGVVAGARRLNHRQCQPEHETEQGTPHRPQLMHPQTKSREQVLLKRKRRVHRRGAEGGLCCCLRKEAPQVCVMRVLAAHMR